LQFDQIPVRGQQLTKGISGITCQAGETAYGLRKQGRADFSDTSAEGGVSPPPRRGPLADVHGLSSIAKGLPGRQCQCEGFIGVSSATVCHGLPFLSRYAPPPVTISLSNPVENLVRVLGERPARKAL
jgi:hypothetical protein